MENPVLAYLLRRIEDSPIEAAPYPHIHACSIFPEDYYLQIQAHLPDVSFFSPAQIDYPKRFHFQLQNNATLMQLPFAQCAFWLDLARTLESGQLLRVLLEKFHETLKERFEKGLSWRSLKINAHLVRDQSDYSIGPHTDHPKKLLSVLFYLPPSDAQKHLGTSLYVPKEKGFRCAGSGHHRFEDFDKVRTAPFLPNSAFAFPKSDISFHGVEPVGTLERERTLLNYIVSE